MGFGVLELVGWLVGWWAGGKAGGLNGGLVVWCKGWWVGGLVERVDGWRGKSEIRRFHNIGRLACLASPRSQKPMNCCFYNLNII